MIISRGLTNEKLDYEIPTVIHTVEGIEAYRERISILSDGGEITELAKAIALTEALEADRIMKGLIK